MNGPILFMRGPDRVIWKMSPTGTNLRRISERAEGSISCASGSPEGRRIAFAGYGRGSAGTEIFKMRANGSRVRRLTNNDVDDFDADWSPSGARLVFSRGTGGASELFLMRSDGSRQRQITEFGRYSYGSSWSPDGKRITYHSASFERPRRLDIFTVNIDGGAKRRLTRTAANGGSSSSPDWSPDGKRIVFASSKDGSPGEIFVMSREGSSKRQLTDNGKLDSLPSWSPDGRFIVFTREIDGKDQIFKMTPRGDNVRRLSNGNRSDYCPEWLRKT